MAPCCIISRPLYLMELERGRILDLHSRIVFLIAFFTRLVCLYIHIHDSQLMLVHLSDECECRWTRLTMWLTWYVGEDTLFTIVMPSSDFFGWTPSFLKVELVNHLLTTTSIGLVQFLSTTVTRVDCCQHIQDKYLMSKMVCYSITSKTLLPACWNISSDGLQFFICSYGNLVNKVFPATIFVYSDFECREPCLDLVKTVACRFPAIASTLRGFIYMDF